MNLDLNSFEGDDDVISINGSLLKVGQLKEVSEKVFRGNLTESLTNALRSGGINVNLGGEQDDNGKWISYTSKRWIDGGIDSEMLRMGASKWVQGKISLKVSLEFVPEEPENSIEFPLDEIRQSLNGVNSIDG